MSSSSASGTTGGGAAGQRHGDWLSQSMRPGRAAKAAAVALRRRRHRSRSLSASSAASSVDTSGIDVQDLDALDGVVHDVHQFSVSLGRLSSVLDARLLTDKPDDGDAQTYCVRVHDALTETSRCFKQLLCQPAFRTADLVAHASTLVHCVKEIKFGSMSESNERAYDAAGDAIGTLEAALANRLRAFMIGEYMTWDGAEQSVVATRVAPSEDSCGRMHSKLSQSVGDLSTTSSTAADQLVDEQQPAVEESAARGTDDPASVPLAKTPVRKSAAGRRSVASAAAAAAAAAQQRPSANQMSMVSAGSSKRHSATVGDGGRPRRHSKHAAKHEYDSACGQLDDILVSMGNGVEVAFHRAKLWSKYCKELLNYMQRRIHLETEHAKQVHKLAEASRVLLHDCGDYLPMQNVFLQNFKVELERAANITETMKMLYDRKVVKRLERCKAEQDKKRKALRELWDRRCKSVHDAVAELRKGKQAAATREQTYRKARDVSLRVELSMAAAGGATSYANDSFASSVGAAGADASRSKVEKKRRTEEDAMVKYEQASEVCLMLEGRLREKRAEMERAKLEVIAQLRELIFQADQTTRACSSAYFQSMANLWAMVPLQYQTLDQQVRNYTPGSEYSLFIDSLQRQLADCLRVISDDELSPVLRPAANGIKPRIVKTESTFDAFEDDNSECYAETSLKGGFKDYLFAGVSEAAGTHKLARIRLPARCDHCDAYTFFQTVQCAECGLSWHKACLPTAATVCGPQPIAPRRMSIFGVALNDSVAESSDRNPVPLVIRCCVQQLERDGLATKGLYRVSGVKSRIELICEQFEHGAGHIDSETPSNVASVIKLYLRQLPEPLLTFSHYADYINVAQSFAAAERMAKAGGEVANGEHDKREAFDKLKHILAQLPHSNYETLKFLLLHLKRVTWFEQQNGMSASNVGIVFGPTLLWRPAAVTGSGTPLERLLEAPVHAKLVQTLLDHVYDLFDVEPSGDKEDFMSKHGHNYEQVPGCVAQREAANWRTATMGSDRAPRAAATAEAKEHRRQSATPDLLKAHPLSTDKAHVGVAKALPLAESARTPSVQSEENVPADEACRGHIQRWLSQPDGPEPDAEHTHVYEHATLKRADTSWPSTMQQSTASAAGGAYRTCIMISPHSSNIRVTHSVEENELQSDEASHVAKNFGLIFSGDISDAVRV